MRTEIESADPYEAASRVGIFVHVGAAGPVGGYGLLSKVESGQPQLELYGAADATSPRHRWTVARAVGVVIVQQHLGVETYTAYDPGAGDEVSLFADEFAGELLMPSDAFRDSYALGNVGQALLFNVPVSVTRPRAINIGIHVGR